MASDQIRRPHLQPVMLECMPQQPGLLGTEDDWTWHYQLRREKKGSESSKSKSMHIDSTVCRNAQDALMQPKNAMNMLCK